MRWDAIPAKRAERVMTQMVIFPVPATATAANRGCMGIPVVKRMELAGVLVHH